MGSISCHITPLVIHGLGGGHAHTHEHTDIRGAVKNQWNGMVEWNTGMEY